MPIINTDYIGVIRIVDGYAKYIKEDIPQKTALINELKTMAENPNRTVFDLKSRMDMEFPASCRHLIDYISPYSYSSSYITGIPYPQAPAFSDYQAEIRKRRDELTSRYSDIYRNLQEEHLPEFNAKVKESVECGLNDFNENTKQSYLRDCIHYCHAYSYSALLNTFRNIPDIKMWSTASIGWSNFSYLITKDIEIQIHTNFGYGGSSYFYLGLTYKGIDILPYSFFVKYYYADCREIARYTRRYSVEHNSWDYAFCFVEDVAKKAAEGDESFASEFIINEVNEMVSSLRCILNNPKAYFDSNIVHKNPNNESHYLNIRGMDGAAILKYSVYPNEMIDVFQAEKISGSLSFLEGISKIESIFDQAHGAADEIRNIALQLVPQLESNIKRIANDIVCIRNKEDELTQRVEELNNKLEPFLKEIDLIYENNDKKAKENEELKKYKYEIENEYGEAHPNYLVLKNRLEESTNEYNTKRSERINREVFLQTLQNCLSEINHS